MDFEINFQWPVHFNFINSLKTLAMPIFKYSCCISGTDCNSQCTCSTFENFFNSLLFSSFWEHKRSSHENCWLTRISSSKKWKIGKSSGSLGWFFAGQMRIIPSVFLFAKYVLGLLSFAMDIQTLTLALWVSLTIPLFYHSKIVWNEEGCLTLIISAKSIESIEMRRQNCLFTLKGASIVVSELK